MFSLLDEVGQCCPIRPLKVNRQTHYFCVYHRSMSYVTTLIKHKSI
jgi:hypothetical protein